MNKQIFILVMLILVTTLSSAYYSGETVYFDFSDYSNIENITYQYVGGIYNYEGLNMIISSSSARLKISENYYPDDFVIIFTITQKLEIDDDSSSSSSSSGSTTTITKTIYDETQCDVTWECLEWEVCFDDRQSRECNVVNNECEESNYSINTPRLSRYCDASQNIYEENLTKCDGIDGIDKVNEKQIWSVIFVILSLVLVCSVIFLFKTNIINIYNKFVKSKSYI